MVLASAKPSTLTVGCTAPLAEEPADLGGAQAPPLTWLGELHDPEAGGQAE
jgi:hypothetical protein